MKLINPKKLPQKSKVLTFFRAVAYIEIALVCQIIASIGTGVKPLILIPFAICVATWSGEVTSACVGMLSGFLLDMSCGRILGFNAVILIVMCTIVSLLHAHLLRRKFLNFFVLTAITCAVQGLLDYFFFYKLWDYKDSYLILHDITFKCFIETMISSVFVYLLINLINKKMKPYQIKSIEEAMQYEHGED